MIFNVVGGLFFSKVLMHYYDSRVSSLSTNMGSLFFTVSHFKYISLLGL